MIRLLQYFSIFISRLCLLVCFLFYFQLLVVPFFSFVSLSMRSLPSCGSKVYKYNVFYAVAILIFQVLESEVINPVQVLPLHFIYNLFKDKDYRNFIFVYFSFRFHFLFLFYLVFFILYLMFIFIYIFILQV